MTLPVMSDAGSISSAPAALPSRCVAKDSGTLVLPVEEGIAEGVMEEVS